MTAVIWSPFEGGIGLPEGAGPRGPSLCGDDGGEHKHSTGLQRQLLTAEGKCFFHDKLLNG